MSNNFFDEYDIYSINKPTNPKLKKIIKHQSLPLSLIKYTFSSLTLLFLMPIWLLFSNLVPDDKELLQSILITECSMFLVFSILAGFILSVTKFPKLQEYKKLFGYID